MSLNCPQCGHVIAAAEPSGVVTRQQAAVLRLLSEGASVEEAAVALFLSWDTVRWHLKNAYHRLGVHTRADAIARARELGLIEGSES